MRVPDASACSLRCTGSSRWRVQKGRGQRGLRHVPGEGQRARRPYRQGHRGRV